MNEQQRIDNQIKILEDCLEVIKKQEQLIELLNLQIAYLKTTTIITYPLPFTLVFNQIIY